MQRRCYVAARRAPFLEEGLPGDASPPTREAAEAQERDACGTSHPAPPAVEQPEEAAAPGGRLWDAEPSRALPPLPLALAERCLPPTLRALHDEQQQQQQRGQPQPPTSTTAASGVLAASAQAHRFLHRVRPSSGQPQPPSPWDEAHGLFVPAAQAARQRAAPHAAASPPCSGTPASDASDGSRAGGVEAAPWAGEVVDPHRVVPEGTEACVPLAHFLDAAGGPESGEQQEAWRVAHGVPREALLRFWKVLDLVTPASRHSNCVTKHCACSTVLSGAARFGPLPKTRRWSSLPCVPCPHACAWRRADGRNMRGSGSVLVSPEFALAHGRLDERGRMHIPRPLPAGAIEAPPQQDGAGAAGAADAGDSLLNHVRCVGCERCGAIYVPDGAGPDVKSSPRVTVRLRWLTPNEVARLHGLPVGGGASATPRSPGPQEEGAGGSSSQGRQDGGRGDGTFSWPDDKRLLRVLGAPGATPSPAGTMAAAAVAGSPAQGTGSPDGGLEALQAARRAAQARWALLGNSLSVDVVAWLLTYLLHAPSPAKFLAPGGGAAGAQRVGSQRPAQPPAVER